MNIYIYLFVVLISDDCGGEFSILKVVVYKYGSCFFFCVFCGWIVMGIVVKIFKYKISFK